MAREADAYDHQHLPPPITLHREVPHTTTEVLKQTIEEDPDYARWVLFRSEKLMKKLTEVFQSGANPRDTDIKEEIAAALLEARELELAIQQNRELARLFTESAEDE